MQIDWLPTAQEDVDAILDYGVDAFGEQAVLRFYQRLKRQETLLLENPYMGKRECLPEELPHEVRSIVFYRHYKLVYYVESEMIHIVALFDTRRNPTSLTGYFR